MTPWVQLDWEPWTRCAQGNHMPAACWQEMRPAEGTSFFVNAFVNTLCASVLKEEGTFTSQCVKQRDCMLGGCV